MACSACEPTATHRANLATRKILRVAVGTPPEDARWWRTFDYVLTPYEPPQLVYGDAQMLCVCDSDIHTTDLGAGLRLASGSIDALTAWASSATVGAGWLVLCNDADGLEAEALEAALDAVAWTLAARGQDPQTLLVLDITDREVRWEVTTHLFEDRPYVDVVFEIIA